MTVSVAAKPTVARFESQSAMPHAVDRHLAADRNVRRRPTRPRWPTSCADAYDARTADLSDRRRHEPGLRPRRPRRPGIGLSLARLNRVIDYPARDMTITVEAGITMAALADTLAAEGQRLPIDAPQPARPRSAAWSPRTRAARGATATARCATT